MPFSEKKRTNVADEDDEFDPNAKKKKAKQKNKPQSVPIPEDTRADLYTLKENHDHLFSSSFDASFNGSGGIDLSSSQAGGAFGFNDNFLVGLDDFEISGELSAELARELGEGWGGSPVKTADQ